MTEARSGGASLVGRVVVVTRPRKEAGELAAMLRRRGAVPLLAPTIELALAPTRLLDEAIDQLASGVFSWVVFTSRAGVESVFARLGTRGFSRSDVRASAAAIGEGTARALRERGVEPALVPWAFTTSALAEAMPAGSGKVLLARADIAPDALEAAVSAKGWTPVRVDAYRTRFARALPPEAARALRDGGVDALTFTSASTVTGFLNIAGTVAGPKVVCIGPVTARAARGGGLKVHAVARPHTIEGLVLALERVFAGRGKGERAGGVPR